MQLVIPLKVVTPCYICAKVEQPGSSKFVQYPYLIYLARMAAFFFKRLFGPQGLFEEPPKIVIYIYVQLVAKSNGKL